MIDPKVVGEEHYAVARQVQSNPATLRGPSGTSSRSWAWTNLSEEDKLTVARARKIERFLSQPFFVAEVFTGSPGKLVDLADTIKGFRAFALATITFRKLPLHGRQHRGSTRVPRSWRLKLPDELRFQWAFGAHREGPIILSELIFSAKGYPFSGSCSGNSSENHGSSFPIQNSCRLNGSCFPRR